MDKLKAASIQSYNTCIDQAVANGQLTQAQADLMKGMFALYNSTDFKSSLQSAFQDVVQDAVNDGVINSAQAAQVLLNQQGNWLPVIPGFTEQYSFHGNGGHNGHGGNIPINITLQRPRMHPQQNRARQKYPR